MGAVEQVQCLEDLDLNQRLVAERTIDRLAIEYPNLPPEEVIDMAISQAQANAPEAKDAVKRIAEMRFGSFFCYLAFYGRDWRAQYMKVGFSAHPEQRLYGIATGNPLDCIWAYVAKVGNRKEAYASEQKILRDLDGFKRRGEWIEVDISSDQQAASIARQMSELIDADFEPFAYRDGREFA